MISAAQLQAFAPRCNAEALAPLLAQNAERCQITTGLRISHWLAQMFVESVGFTVLEEDLNYSAQALVKTWPNRFPNIAFAEPYGRNPEKIANRVYANRMGNGDESTGDGWKYRGRGLMMNTGLYEYQQDEKVSGLPLVAQPDLLLQFAPAATAAADFWRSIDVNQHADQNDIVAVTRAVNGGLNGIQDRKDAFGRARAIWSA